jgi:hypothetical protein
MDTRATRAPGGWPVVGIALAAAVFITVWWGVVGAVTENFGSDCLFYFGETGPRAEHCQQVNDRAEVWLPRLVAVAWTSVVLCLLMPRRFPPGRHAAGGSALVCLTVAVALGVHAWSVSAP